MSSKWSNLNPYDLHKALINEYLLTKKGSTTILKRDNSRDKTDFDVIRENHQFLWEDEDSSDTWERRQAKKYYDKLYKEYAIGDLSRFKENKVGLRWRTEQELIDGRGHFTCGNKRCSERKGLRTWEVNFGYIEQGSKKNALVKLRLCPDCSYKLNYHYKKKEVKRLKKHKKEKESSPAADTSVSNVAIEDKEIANDEKQSTSKAKDDDGNGIWQQRPTQAEEKSRDEEFQDYLEQLFL